MTLQHPGDSFSAAGHGRDAQAELMEVLFGHAGRMGDRAYRQPSRRGNASPLCPVGRSGRVSEHIGKAGLGQGDFQFDDIAQRFAGVEVHEEKESAAGIGAHFLGRRAG